MHLLVISHIVHEILDGQPYGPDFFVKEINWLAAAFDEVTLLTCQQPHAPHVGKIKYDANINFVGLPPSGGYTIPEKMRTIFMAARYMDAIFHYIKKADVVHVRVPGGLGLYGMMISSFFPKTLKWYKYAGNFISPRPTVKYSYLQYLWMSKGLGRAPVVINGSFPGQQKYLYSFLNPSFSISEVQEINAITIEKQLSVPLQILFAGRLEKGKGADLALKIVRRVNEHHPVQFDVFGDGPDRDSLENLCRKLDIQNRVKFHGWKSQEILNKHLVKAHFVLLPSSSEGWPKILSEGMVHGAVPVASQISSIPQVFSRFNTGIARPVDDIEGFAQAIITLVQDPARWKAMSYAGQKAARFFTYEKYMLFLEEMFQDYYHRSPFKQEVVQEHYQLWDKTNGNGYNQ